MLQILEVAVPILLDAVYAALAAFQVRNYFHRYQQPAPTTSVKRSALRVHRDRHFVTARFGAYFPENIMALRWTTSATFLGMPLVAVAIGPDLEKNELRGHARGLIAIGDIATGVLALGGLARGVVALGGLSLGVIAMGGLSSGIFTFGGLAIGVVAVGGCALGYVAVGGFAVGIYAIGGVAIGKYVIGPLSKDPEAVEFFARYLPWIRRLL